MKTTADWLAGRLNTSIAVCPCLCTHYSRWRARRKITTKIENKSTKKNCRHIHDPRLSGGSLIGISGNRNQNQRNSLTCISHAEYDKRNEYGIHRRRRRQLRESFYLLFVYTFHSLLSLFDTTKNDDSPRAYVVGRKCIVNVPKKRKRKTKSKRAVVVVLCLCRTVCGECKNEWEAAWGAFSNSQMHKHDTCTNSYLSGRAGVCCRKSSG